MTEPPRDPPTEQQRAATAQSDPPTRQQVRHSDPATVQKGATAHDPPTTRQGTGTTFIPPELRDEYDFDENLGAGSEGVVWLARSKETGEPYAVKVHSPEHPLDKDLLTWLADHERFARHAPRIHRTGASSAGGAERTWVLMEYLPHGSLARLIAEESTDGGGLPVERAEEVFAELAEAIHFWQTEIERNPLDLKPSNLMVRSWKPFRLIVSDLGGVVRMTISQQYGQVVATTAYMPPEGLAEWRAREWPWWALGEIAYELITGRRRFGDEWRIRHDRVFGELDLSAVDDPRWRRLIRGLLTRLPTYRWGHEEVRRWLAGEEPPLHTHEPDTEDAGPSSPPIVFQGRNHHDPGALAAALVDAPEAAADWISGQTQTLFDWLETGIKDNRFARHDYLRGLSGDRARAHRAVTAFAATYLPHHPPTYRGHTIDAEGMLDLAADPTSDPATLREIIDGQILAIAAQHPCDHDSCADRCAVLDRVADEVPRVLAAVRARAPQTLSAGERDQAAALAVRLTLRPEDAAQVLRTTISTRVRRVAWWRDLLSRARQADRRTVDGRADLITAAVMAPRALLASQEDRKQRNSAAKARLNPRRKTDRRAAGIAGFLAATAAGPWALGHYVWRPKLLETTVLPPPNPRAFPPGHTLVPDYLFGLLVVGGLLGLVLLRPPWSGRARALFMGLVLVAAGVASPNVANSVTDRYDSAGRNAYRSGPIPIKVIGPVCGTYWTSDSTPHWRYALVGVKGDECSQLVAYRAWHRVWRVRAARSSAYTALGSSGATLVVREVRTGRPDRLMGVSQHSGHIAWRFACPAGGELGDVTYHGIRDHSDYSGGSAYIAATCEGVAYKVDYHSGHSRRG